MIGAQNLSFKNTGEKRNPYCKDGSVDKLEQGPMKRSESPVDIFEHIKHRHVSTGPDL